jgi:hypoxanthine phosphoribosyltransferase
MIHKAALANDIDHVLVSEEELDRIVSEMAAQLDKDYGEDGKDLLLLGILKGSVVFMADLMKKLTIPVEIDFMKVSSYGGDTQTSGRIKIHLDLNRSDISDCNILVVEDIIDSGKTLSYLTEYLRLGGAKSVRTCTLLDKPDRREVNFQADYVGAVIPDEFVVGYGLDYSEKYRALPYVGVLKRSVYEK